MKPFSELFKSDYQSIFLEYENKFGDGGKEIYRFYYKTLVALSCKDFSQ